MTTPRDAAATRATNLVNGWIREASELPGNMQLAKLGQMIAEAIEEMAVRGISKGWNTAIDECKKRVVQLFKSADPDWEKIGVLIEKLEEMFDGMKRSEEGDPIHGWEEPN